MADLPRNGSAERDIEQAITALKKGAYLLKYGRRGKPKFCPFRLSNDESILIWYSGKEEKHLKLCHVSRIVPGQRTAIFQRHPRPEKEYQSFSLIYSDRSLDLICKDKDEAEVWFVGLKALICRSQQRRWRTDSRSDGAMSSDTNSPSTYTRRNSPLTSVQGSADSIQKESGALQQSPYGSPPRHGLEKTLSESMMFPISSKGFFQSESVSGSLHSVSSEGGSDNAFGHTRAGTMDTFRISLSSAVSSSSHGSAPDDGDALGDVYIWGEGAGDGILGGGVQKIRDTSDPKLDSLLPKPLESAVVLDVHNIACGKRHAALVTKQGEVFSWGEESGGRLGHGVDIDISHPKLLDSLTNTNIELVACGEFHACAVTLSGELYTWGDGTHNYGLLGHGTEVSHWVPKKVTGPLEGIHISSVSCGPWHTAIVTSAGQLFTFGDGSFGALGHGDKTNTVYPREVESLKGLRTVRAACGVWHTAAIVEVMVGSSSLSNTSSGKLFTWGDGDKSKLGHGEKETKLVPTCVAALVEPNFRQVVCGHSLTVALTTLGHVYTMGSPVHGQLGNPQTDGKIPVRVEGKLRNAFVEDIACGSFHVAVLTSKTEVYTWGKGANGRLGHGDIEDKSNPSLVEALKDKQVKSIACGSSFTAAICLHKWVSGADQSVCSGCKLPFGFTRKRHNCYNCGLVFCHACSSKKSVRASLAPNPNKPYRVCDNCFTKLKKMLETSSSVKGFGARRGAINQRSYDAVDKPDRLDNRIQPELSWLSNNEILSQCEGRSSSKRNKKLEFHSSRVSPIPNSSSQWGNNNNSKYSSLGNSSSKKLFSASVPGSRVVSRTTSPVSRRSSPPRSATPTPTLAGLASPKICVNNMTKTSDTLSQEVVKLKLQVESLSRRSQLQEVELERSTKQLKEAMSMANEESAKCKAAKDVIKSLTAQLKDMAERLPGGIYRYSKPELFRPYGANGTSHTPVSDITVTPELKVIKSQTYQSNINSISPKDDSSGRVISQVENGIADIGNGYSYVSNKRPTLLSHMKPLEDSKKFPSQNFEEMSGVDNTMQNENEQGNEAEWVEQDEQGVYITLSSLPGGGKDLKRVRFSRKKFSEKEAEEWWQENRARIYEQYNIRIMEKSNIGPVTSSGRLESI